jgi:Pvc16 N-terminal domain
VIQLVDRAVERFLREIVPLDEGAVDVSFDAPDRTWGAALTRPAVNVFLWEVARNPAYLRAGMQQRKAPEGAIERRPATPVVDLHYLITAWATELADEHQLLGSVLTSVLAHNRLPDQVLTDTLAGVRVGMALAPYEKRVPGEFWSALDGRLKPGLQLELNLPVEVFEWQATAQPAESVAATVGRLADRADHANTSHRDTEAEPPALRRRRSGGALVMEGRPEPPPTAR